MQESQWLLRNCEVAFQHLLRTTKAPSNIADDDVRIVIKLVKPSYLVGSKQFVSLRPNLFPPRRWGFREFVSVRELLGHAAAE